MSIKKPLKSPLPEDFLRRNNHNRIYSTNKIEEGMMIGIYSDEKLDIRKISKIREYTDKEFNSPFLAYSYELRSQINFNGMNHYISNITFWKEDDHLKKSLDSEVYLNLFLMFPFHNTLDDKVLKNKEYKARFGGVYLINKKLEEYIIDQCSKLDEGQSKEINYHSLKGLFTKNPPELKF